MDIDRLLFELLINKIDLYLRSIFSFYAKGEVPYFFCVLFFDGKLSILWNLSVAAVNSMFIFSVCIQHFPTSFLAMIKKERIFIPLFFSCVKCGKGRFSRSFNEIMSTHKRECPLKLFVTLFITIIFFTVATIVHFRYGFNK